MHKLVVSRHCNVTDIMCSADSSWGTGHDITGTGIGNTDVSWLPQTRVSQLAKL